jgi:hypothetical protein
MEKYTFGGEILRQWSILDGWLDTGSGSFIWSERLTLASMDTRIRGWLMMPKDRSLIGMERLALAMARQAMDH